jgi:peptide/nickel transport system permease protein
MNPLLGPEPSAGPQFDFEVALVSLNQWQLAWRRFRRHKLAMFGTGLFFIMAAISIFGPFLLPYNPLNVPAITHFCAGSTTLPSYNGCPPLTPGHPMGTEGGGLGIDLLTVVVNGGRISLAIGVGASVFAAILGTIVGGFAGYFGGWIDTIAMRTVDVLLSLPIVIVITVFAKAFGLGDWRVILVIFAVLSWPGLARLVRSLFLTLRTEVFVDAARAVGVSDRRIIFRHILPNAMSPIIVSTTLSIAAIIVTEAFVDFLGYGVDPNKQPTWGNILTRAQDAIVYGNWWWGLFPGLAIVITVLGINFMGDGLRDALDPRSRE